MNIQRLREARHGYFKMAVAFLPIALLFGCNSAPTGTAPGLAGGQALTPGITNYPMAYVKQPVLTKSTDKKNKAATPDDIDVRDLITSITGSDLYVRNTASAATPEVNVTFPLTNGQGAVRDLDVSPDGTKVVFSLRMPLTENLANDDPKQPNWHIYQYDAATKAVTQLTNDDVTAGHDVGAHFLPDGRIIFASTRQLATQAILIDEGRPQYQAVTTDQQQAIFLLHVMNGDGTNMHQISFNTNHDFAPSILANGQAVFSRWDTENGDEISLYVTNPDGTAEQLYYGANSHATGNNIAGTNNNVIQFLNARQRADGQLLAIARPFIGTQLGGDIVAINAQNFVEINQPSSPTSTVKGPGQVSATSLGVTTDANMPSPGGRFYSMYPLYDGTNRMLVSWAPCLISGAGGTTEVCSNTNTTGANVVLAPPQYTVWIYDFDAGTLMPLLSAEQGTEIVEPVISAGPQSRTGLHSGFLAGQRRPANPGEQRRRHTQHLERLRLRRRRYGEAGHRHAGESGECELLHAAGAIRPHREGRRDSAQDGAQDRPERLRTRRHGHARDPGLCAGATRRLGVDPGARAGTFHHRRARWECATHHRAAHELDVAATRRDQVLQRLPHGGQCHGPLARPRRPHGAGEPGRADHRLALPGHVLRAVRQRGRDHGADALAHQLRDRQRTRNPGASHTLSRVPRFSRPMSSIRRSGRTASPRPNPMPVSISTTVSVSSTAPPPKAFRARRP